jgi:hypothetical protein
MQLPPLTFTDISLLFMVGAIVLLITAELASPYYGQTKLIINRQKLKNAAYATGAIFLITAVINVIIIISS